MNQRLFHTDEILRITGISGRTFSRYTKQGFIVPVKREDGRGRARLYDDVCAVWAMTVHELIALWPGRDAAAGIKIYFHPGRKRDKPLGLRDGGAILAQIRAENEQFKAAAESERQGRSLPSDSQDSHPPSPLTVVIANGWRGFGEGERVERFQEVDIMDYSDAWRKVAGFIRPKGRELVAEEGLVNSAAVLNLASFYVRIRRERRKMGI